MCKFNIPADNPNRHRFCGVVLLAISIIIPLILFINYPRLDFLDIYSLLIFLPNFCFTCFGFATFCFFKASVMENLYERRMTSETREEQKYVLLGYARLDGDPEKTYFTYYLPILVAVTTIISFGVVGDNLMITSPICFLFGALIDKILNLLSLFAK